MSGALHTDAYKAVVAELVQLRKTAGLSQAAVAAQLFKPPSFVAKYELCERRLDVVEFFNVLNILTDDPQREIMRFLDVVMQG